MATADRWIGLTAKFFVILTIIPQNSGQVAFMMTKGTLHPAYNRYITFKNVVTAVNAHVLPEFGAFVPNVSGLYQFSLSAATKLRSPFRISLKRAQETVATLYGSFSDYQQVSQTVVVQLDPQQYVYPYIELGDIFESPIEDRTYTVFSGFMIAELPPGTFNPQASSPTSVMDQSTGPRYASKDLYTAYNPRLNYMRAMKGFRTIIEQSIKATNDNSTISSEP